MSTPHMRVLILDDDANLTTVIAMMARETLAQEPNVHIETVTSVDQAEAAIERLAASTHECAVFISDYHLPPSARTGLDVLGNVRRRLPAAKRVLMSGRERAELEPALGEAGLDAFLAKPFTLDEFRPLVQRLVDDARRAPPSAMHATEAAIPRG